MTRAVECRLAEYIASNPELPEPYTRPHPDHYVMYPLFIDPAGHFCVASAVWNVGQSTPIHSHETWGVLGILAGEESETRYHRPVGTTIEPLVPMGEHVLTPGMVEVCCTTDEDVHSVSAHSDIPCVGIHIYGADICAIDRTSFATDGSRKKFRSTWATPL